MVSLEYIAGFFDGEGFISIQKASHRSHSGSRYWLTVSFCNTHRGIMDEIQKVVGGKVLFYDKTRRSFPHYRLTLYSRQASGFIKTVLPYLIVKKQEAEIAMKYQNGIRHVGSGRGLTEQELAFQDKCYSDMREYHGTKIAHLKATPVLDTS